uniref:Uncharacterized protein n=1 Tax=Panagrolaimus sp. ES5 TaxID=591445 RepID=A0AC34GD78_9BILA
MPNSSGNYPEYYRPIPQRSFSGRGQPPNRNRQNGQESENERRKRSFVVIGLQTLPVGTENEIRDQDHLAAMDIVRYLGVEDDIQKSQVKRARNGPVLIITLESVESRDLILKRSHFLRNNDDTRHLKVDKAYTAEDMVQRFGRLPNDEDLDDPNSEYNNVNRPGVIRRPHQGNDYNRPPANYGDVGYRNNRSGTNSHNNDFYPVPARPNNDYGHIQRVNNNPRGGRGYSRNRDDSYSNEIPDRYQRAPPSRNHMDDRRPISRNYDGYRGYNNDSDNNYNQNPGYDRNQSGGSFRRNNNNNLRENP